MKIRIIIIFIFTCNVIFSQNILFNGDFESFSNCRNINLTFDSILCKYGPKPFYAEYWYFPLPVHADYLNDSCPNSMRLFQKEIYKEAPIHEGIGCVGFNLFGPDGFFEPITGTFVTPMIKDSIYIISFSLCFMKGFSEFYSKKVGIKLTNDLQVYPLPFLREESNYIEMFKKGYFVQADYEMNISELADSTYWQEYSFSYKSKGGEKYITIGMFYQPNYDLIKYCKQFRSYCWNKKAKPWLRINRNSPILVFKGNISTFLNLDETQKSMCYYLLDDVSVTMKKSNYK